MDNERGVGMQWRGRWCLGGVVNEITQKLELLKLDKKPSKQVRGKEL